MELNDIDETKSNGLFWHAESDDNDNTFFEAASPYSSDGESVDIHWRIRQKLEQDKIVWYADHDGELVDSAAEDEWAMLTHAIKYITKQHADIVSEGS